MQRYFITGDNFTRQTFDANQTHHMKHVMRMKQGERVIVCSEGNCYNTRLVFEDNQVSFEIVEQLNGLDTSRPEVTLIQGYPKSDKLEFIIEKATELGVDHIVPTMMRRSIVKLDDDKKSRRIERLRKIALEAAEQSHRFTVPVIHDIMTFQEMLSLRYDHLFVAYESAALDQQLKHVLTHVKPTDKIAFVIGPEGGIDAEELKILVNHNAKIVSLGSRILRTETAGLYILSCISYAFE